MKRSTSLGMIFPYLGRGRRAFAHFAIFTVCAGWGCETGVLPVAINSPAEEIVSPPLADDPPISVAGVTGPNDFAGPAEELNFVATAVFCCSPLSIEFNVEDSSLNPTLSADFTWEFGDGRAAQGRSVQHDYAWPGVYPVVLSARLGDGRTITAHRVVKLVVDESGRLEAVVAPGPQTADPVDGLQGGDTEPPTLTVNAGPDRVVPGGSEVTLVGTLRMTGGPREVRLHWVQISGPYVAVGDAHRSQAFFRAPFAEPDEQTLVFRFQAETPEVVVADEVSITVEAEEAPVTNVPPMAFDGEAVIMTGELTTLTLSGSDAENDDLTFSVIVPPARGRLGAMDNGGASSATVLYIPPAGFAGRESFIFRAHDGTTSSIAATFTVVIRAANADLQMADATYLVPMEQAVQIPLRATVGGNGDPVSGFSITTVPTHGRLGEIQSTGPNAAVVSYTPFPRFQGTDKIQVQGVRGSIRSTVASITLTVRPLLIPWLEVNSPHSNATQYFTAEQGAHPGMTELDYCLDGLDFWARITHTVIVTTTNEQIERLYPALMSRKPPHLRIIGGIKTYTVPGALPGDDRPYDFADQQAWVAITDGLERIGEITRTPIVVLENETALRPYFRGQSGLDFEKLAIALAPLGDSGLVTWSWLPWIESDTGAFPSRETDSTAFVQAVAAALPNNVFMTDYVSWYAWETMGTERIRRQRMEQLLGTARVQDGYFVTETGWMDPPSSLPRRCYTPAEVKLRLPGLQRSHMRLYTGGANWILVGRQFVTLLPPLAEVLSD